VVSCDVLVLTSPGYSMRSPPTVNQMRLVHSLLGLSAATMRRYVGQRPAGMSDFLMKNIVFVPLMPVSLFPCAKRPISSAVSRIQAAPSELVRSSRYSAGCLVSGWTAE